MSWRQGQTAILTPSSSSTIAALSHLGWGCSTVGHWGPKALCLPLALISASCLQLTRTAPGTWLYYCLTFTCFRLFTQVHLLIDGSVEGQYFLVLWFSDFVPSIVYFKKEPEYLIMDMAYEFLTFIRFFLFRFISRIFLRNIFPKLLFLNESVNIKIDPNIKTNNWYMHNPESVLENEMHKLLRDFEIQTNHQISARRPDLTIINKKRELAEIWTLLSRRTTEWNWKNGNRGISTTTLLENWKSWGTWKWRLYQF